MNKIKLESFAMDNIDEYSNHDDEPNEEADSNENKELSCPFSNDNDVRKFHVLDEVDNESDSLVTDSDSDIPDDEVERMLEDALNDKKRTAEEAELGT